MKGATKSTEGTGGFKAAPDLKSRPRGVGADGGEMETLSPGRNTTNHAAFYTRHRVAAGL